MNCLWSSSTCWRNCARSTSTSAWRRAQSAIRRSKSARVGDVLAARGLHPSATSFWVQQNVYMVAERLESLRSGEPVCGGTGTFDLTAKFPGYKYERVAAPVTAIYSELKN